MIETTTAAAETETTEAIQAAAAKPAASPEAEATVYIGPDIQRVAINGTAYIGGLPEELNKKIEQIPAIKGLIVPVSGLAKAEAMIAKEGTGLNNLYKAVQIELQKEG